MSEEALQIIEKRREAKGKGVKERYIHLNEEFQRIAKTDKNAFFSDQCKEIEENNRLKKTRDSFKEINPEYSLYRRQGSRASPRKRNAKRQNGCLMRPYE